MKTIDKTTDKKRLNEDVDADIKRRTHNSYLGYVIEPSEELLAAARDYLQKNGVRAQLKQYKDSNRYDCTVSPKWGYLVDGFENLGSKFNPDYDGTIKGYFRNESWEKYVYFCVKGPRFSKVYDLPESLNKSNKLTLKEDLFDEIDMSTLLDQGYRVDMSVYNDSPQEDALEGPQTEEEVGVSHLILDAISCVTEMISMYNDITANTSDEEITSVINQIAEDNNKHMGMLQGILTNVSPNAEAIQDGVEEVAADEVATVDPEFIPVEESLDEEVSDTTLIGKVVANDGKELQKVLAKCGYSNVKHEGHYVFSAIKDGKVVYIDTNPLDDNNESEKIEIKSISESLNEDLHDKFKKDIKNAYKQWAAEVEKVEQQRKDLKDKFQDVESEEKKKEYEELTDKLFPMPADFKFEFPKNIEKDDFPFYVTYYAEYPIYEPAEGGYYYAGKDAIWSEGINSEEEAWDYVNDFINEQEDKTEWEKFSDGYLLRGQYIGEDQSIIIEPRDSYLSAVKGWEPYQ